MKIRTSQQATKVKNIIFLRPLTITLGAVLMLNPVSIASADLAQNTVSQSDRNALPRYDSWFLSDGRSR